MDLKWWLMFGVIIGGFSLIVVVLGNVDSLFEKQIVYKTQYVQPLVTYQYTPTQYVTNEVRTVEVINNTMVIMNNITNNITNSIEPVKRGDYVCIQRNSSGLYCYEQG